MSREQDINLPPQIVSGAVFSEPAPHVSKQLIRLVQISIENGGWEKITPRRKQLLALHLVDGLNYHQIGDELGISTQSVSHTLKPVPTELFSSTVLGIIRQPISINEKAEKTQELADVYTEYQKSLVHKKRDKV